MGKKPGNKKNAVYIMGGFYVTEQGVTEQIVF
jgi:hypothetical protein